MTIQDIVAASQAEFQKVENHLQEEYSRLQVGRANPSLVEGVMVEVYGSMQPLKAVAGISIPDARTIQIQPWDRGSLAPIEKAILASNLGLNPVNDGIVVRINIPQLTEERRKDLVKVVHKLAEEARISIRNYRQDAHSEFKKLRADSAITEDDQKLGEKLLQEKVDKANENIEHAAKAKEQDVMTI